MSDNRLPALVVGTGFGCRIQVPALRAAGFDVVGMVGTDAERTRRRASDNGVPAAFVDLNQAITATGAVAVTIATPPHTHIAQTLTAIERGCHVLCEKPFSMNAEEARIMLDAAERAGVCHALGYEFRWSPDRVTAALVLANGVIGEPRMATFVQYLHYAGNPEVDLPGWWRDPAAGGGWLGASGSHIIDWIRTWLGDFETVSGALPAVTSPPQTAADSFIVRFGLQGGLQGTLQCSGGAWGPPAGMVRVAGTAGTLWIESGRVWVADRHGTREIAIAPELTLALEPLPTQDPRQQSAEWKMLTAAEFHPYVALCRAWRAAIEGKASPGPVIPATFADGVAAMDVLDAIDRSARLNGASVNVRPRAEQPSGGTAQ